jgi:High potential iron-sulfur protein
MSKSLQRRTLIKAVLLGSAGLPLASRLVQDAQAAAQPLVDPNDVLAKALNYSPDTTKVAAAAFPTHKPTQKCGNCIQFQGKAADKQGACNLFPGKDVMSGGWCKVWAQKPGT